MADDAPTLSAYRANLRPGTHNTRDLMLAVGSAAPSDGDKGYAPGCRFWVVSASNIDTANCYINTGTAASCNFDAYQQVLLDSGTEFALKDEDGNYLFATGDTTTVPTGTGYAKRCLYICSTEAKSTTMNATWYINVGGATTADFNAVTLTVAS